MTVKELIEALQTYPITSEVVGEWDSGWSDIYKIELQTDKKARPVVVLDVADYGSFERDLK